MPTTEENRLPKFEEELRRIWQDLTVTPVLYIDKPKHGKTRAPSTRVRLSSTEGTSPVYAPWPKSVFSSPRSLGAIFLIEGAAKVFPVIRIVEPNKASQSESYVTLDHWLLDALTNWRFKTKEENENSTFAEQIERCDAPKSKLLLIRNCIDYAITGAQKFDVKYGTIKKYSPDDLQIVPQASCLIEIPSIATEFRLLQKTFAEFRLSEYAVLDTVTTYTRRPKPKTPPILAIPRQTQDKFYKFGKRKKASEFLAGIDPYHTPEDDDTRFKLHSSHTAEITEDQRLIDPAEENPHSLSASTSQIPYAGYNEPRRLLLGTKQQSQAQDLCQPDRPLVVSRQHRSELDPPGKNLRVAFLAWAGWNHEDAWVISESCAHKLRCVITWKQTIQIPVHATYSAPEVGKAVEKGQCLVEIKQDHVFLNNGSDRTAVSEVEIISEQIEANTAEHEGKIVHVNIHAVSDSLDAASTSGNDWHYHSVKTTAAVITVYLERELPCEVGDKLANRHGHKGVVGLILPDELMPKWRGKPLEVLIDPISVVNRANWGQVYETLVGGLRSDTDKGNTKDDQVSEEHFCDLNSIRAKNPELDKKGRTHLEFSPQCRWRAKTPSREPEGKSNQLRGVAGSQFVMRLPHHAEEKVRGGAEGRKKRIDRLSRFALWAHDIKTPRLQFSKETELLRLGLWLLGVDMRLTNDQVTFERVRLDLDEVTDKVHECQLRKGKKGNSMETQLLRLKKGEKYFCKLSAPLALKKEGKELDLIPWENIYWLPVISLKDARTLCDWRADADFQHTIPSSLEAYASAIVRGVEQDICEVLTQLMEEVAQHLLGLIIGRENTKNCFWNKQVISKEVSSSGQAVITPRGLPLEPDLLDTGADSLLNLNEVTLPTAHKKWFVSEEDNDPPTSDVWLKRDPVLHRYGVLPLKAKCTQRHTNTIQLPASLLSPLAADFDGDTATVFAVNADTPEELSNVSSLEKCRPSMIQWDNILRQPKYKPSKQYQHGLYLLQENEKERELMRRELEEQGAPRWPDHENVTKALNEWLEQVSQIENADPRWWSIMEYHALLSLSRSPDMDFGVVNCCSQLKELDCVRSGAANLQLHENTWKEENTGDQILNGKALDFFRNGYDPILVAMDERSKGYFGTECEKLIARKKSLKASEAVQKIQAFTEELQQEALNTKKTTDRYKHSAYETDLEESLRQGSPAGRLKKLAPALHDILPEIVEERGNKESDFDYLIYRPYDLLKRISPHDVDSSDWKALTVNADDTRTSIFFH